MTGEQEILALEERLTEADASPVADTRPILRELLDDEAVLVGPQGDLYDKNFVVDRHGPERQPFREVRVEEMKVTMLTDAAVVHSVNTYVTPAATFRLRFFRVWRRRDGQWKVLGGTTTVIPEKTAQP